MRISYHARVSVITETFGLQAAALPPNLPELIEASAYHELPFAEEDKNFRDSVMVLSAVRVAADGDVVMILSEDRFIAGFDNRTIDGRSVVVMNLHDCEDEMERAVAESAKSSAMDQVRAIEKYVAKTLMDDLAGLEAFVQQNLELPEALEAGPFGRLQRVDGLEVQRVVRATVPVPTKPFERAKLLQEGPWPVAATCDVLLDATFVVAPRPSPRILRVGSPTPSLVSVSGPALGLESQTSREFVEVEVAVEAIVNPAVGPDSEPTIEYASCSLVQPSPI
jgi:hypothetical protein